MEKNKVGRPKNENNLPEEFSLSRYSNQHRLTPYEWYLNLKYRLYLSLMDNTEKKRNKVIELFKSPIFFQENQNNIENLIDIECIFDDKEFWKYLGVKPISISDLYQMESNIEKDLKAECREFFGLQSPKKKSENVLGLVELTHGEGVYIDEWSEKALPFTCFSVDLTIPDKELCQQFQYILKRIRKRIDIENKLPIKPLLKDYQDYIDSWIEYEILAFKDLQLWEIAFNLNISKIHIAQNFNLNDLRTTKNKIKKTLTKDFLDAFLNCFVKTQLKKTKTKLD